MYPEPADRWLQYKSCSSESSFFSFHELNLYLWLFHAFYSAFFLFHMHGRSVVLLLCSNVTLHTSKQHKWNVCTDCVCSGTVLPHCSPVSFKVDLKHLRDAYKQLQRVLHPDRFSTKSEVQSLRYKSNTHAKEWTPISSLPPLLNMKIHAKMYLYTRLLRDREMLIAM